MCCNEVFSFSFFLLLPPPPLHHHHHHHHHHHLHLWGLHYGYLLPIIFFYCRIYSFHIFIISSVFIFTLCPHLSCSIIVSCNLPSSFSLCVKSILDFPNHSLLFPSQSFPYFCFCLPYFYFSLISLQNIPLSVSLTVDAYNFFYASFFILTFPLTSFHLCVCFCLLLAIFQEQAFFSVVFVETVTGQCRNDNGSLI